MSNNPSNSKVFDFIVQEEPELQIADIDKTKTVDLFAKPEEKGWTKEGVHNALMVAGFTPVIGNAADLIDAGLYAMEGEFGSAALSGLAAIPVIGQISSGLKVGQKILKEAVDKGDELITILRGVDKWYPGKMVKNKMFVGGGGKGVPTTKINLLHGRSPNELYVTQNKNFAQEYASRKGGDGIILEFQVPKSYMKKTFTTTNPYTLMRQGKHAKANKYKLFDESETGMFKEGLPVNFLTKVHR